MTDWVPVRRFASQAEAQIAAGYLRAEGVDARLPDEAFLSVHPEIGLSSCGGHRVEAPKDQRWRADALLRAREEPPAPRAPRARHGLLSLILGRGRGQ